MRREGKQERERKGWRKRREKELIGKQSMKGKRRKTGWGVGGKRDTQRHREFCNNLNSFQTMSKEPWQHGLKQTLPLIL